MKAFLIKPLSRSVIEVDYDGGYQDILDYLGCDVFTTARFNRENDVVFVDDEGLLLPFTFSDMFLIEGYPQPLVGRGLVLGTDQEGESIEPSISLDEIKSMVTFWPDFNPMDY